MLVTRHVHWMLRTVWAEGGGVTDGRRVRSHFAVMASKRSKAARARLTHSTNFAALRLPCQRSSKTANGSSSDLRNADSLYTGWTSLRRRSTRYASYSIPNERCAGLRQ